MPTVSTDLLVYGAIAVAFMVFNYIVQKLSERARAEQVQEPEPEPAFEPMDEPADQPIRTYRLAVDEGQIWIDPS